MVATKSKTKSRNGRTYRICGECGVEKELTAEFFDQRQDNRKGPTFRGICRDCRNNKARQQYQKLIGNPVTADEVWQRNRDRSLKQRKKRRVWVPKDTVLASCTLCCRNLKQGFYVYAHELIGRGFFYIGKGSGRRAWDTNNRSPNWKTFVGRNFDKGVLVHILHDGLSNEDAYEIEKQKIEALGFIHEGDGQLINLAEGGKGPSSEDMKRRWQKRLADPKGLKRAQEIADENFNSDEVRSKAIKTRENNESYKNKRKERLKGYSTNPEMMRRAVEKRAKNPQWRENVRFAAKERFKDPATLRNHQRMMRTDDWINKHQAGVAKKFNKSTRMWFPASWGHSDFYVDWQSRVEMCEAMGFNRGKVSDVINGNRKHHHRFFFENIETDQN